MYRGQRCDARRRHCAAGRRLVVGVVDGHSWKLKDQAKVSILFNLLMGIIECL